MTIKRILGSITGAVFVVMLIITLLLTDVQLAAFNRDYYNQKYEKYQIPQNIGISMPDLMASTEILLNYMDGKRDNLNFQMPINGVQQEFFSQRDKTHMIDVKNLIVQGKLIRNTAFWYVALYVILFYFIVKNKQKRFSKLMIYAVVAGLIPVLLLAILMNIDFYKYFTIFHEIFFNNDLWQLDPAQDRLINMFPETFFSSIAYKIVFLYISELILMLAAGIFGMKYKRRKLNAK